jgi:NAD+ kinase
VDREHLHRALAALGEGNYFVEGRTGLSLRPVPHVALQTATAFNDIVFTRAPGRGQAALELRVDGELLVRYSSDGVIVATAQGSTAYSFAAGGPLVSPRAHGMIITPDAPHGLFNRAVVLAQDECLTVEFLPGAPVSVEVDGRLLGHAEVGARFDVLAHPGAAQLVRLQPDGFPERARRKLGITDPAVLADYDLAGHER